MVSKTPSCNACVQLFAPFKIFDFQFDSKYLDKKKWAVYNELKRAYPILVKKNKLFFHNQKKKDNLLYK